MSTVLTINARDGLGLTAMKTHLRLTPAQFRKFIRAHHEILETELAKHDVVYQDLGPALVPQTKRHETALLFNSDLSHKCFYGYAVAEYLIPRLDKGSTHSVMTGDISLPPQATMGLASLAGLIRSSVDDVGNQYIYCVYLNNLSVSQRDRLHAQFLKYPGYLGHVPTTYRSKFRTLVAHTVGTTFIKLRSDVLVSHGGDPPWVDSVNLVGFPFEESGLRVVSVNDQLFSPLLVYKIQSEMFPHHQEDVEVSLNAISAEPLPLSGLEILLPEAKFGYLSDAKSGLLRAAGLDARTREGLAAVIREELENDYIYRLRYNVDGTVQFSIILELPREGTHPVRVSVGLKYLPDQSLLSLVTLT